MDKELIDEIHKLNPWLASTKQPIFAEQDYIPRTQSKYLLDPEWDSLITVLIGPRQAGKTTLGKYLCHQLIMEKRFTQLIYLNCDLLRIREWIKGLAFLTELQKTFKLTNFILFIDEVQRLKTPGLILKAIADLKLPIKLIASGSSQLEIKSKVQEFLTGRHIEAIILPLSWQELSKKSEYELQLIYGCYPQIIKSKNKEFILKQLYDTYIHKDIIEILKIRSPDTMEKLLGLLSHASGQLTNYNQLATDCRMSIPTIQHYTGILEATYIIYGVKPFVGNKRQELTGNPIYYFIDNGFRNHTLFNFNFLSQRSDAGFLVENAVFQEILKFKVQHFKSFNIHYWRTKGGAEVDFILYQNDENFIPIEVKYRNLSQLKLTRGFRSFIETYKPQRAFMITKNFTATEVIAGCSVECVPLEDLGDLITTLDGLL